VTPFDDDTGPNNLQNYPELTTATTDLVTEATRVTGTLMSTPSTTFTVEFFRTGQCDAAGFGEGETLVHTLPVTTDATGVVAVDEALPVSVPVGLSLTATATDPLGNTSEFSNCILVTRPLKTLTVVKAGPGAGTVRTLGDNGVGLTCGTGGTDCTEAYAQDASLITLRAEPEVGVSEFIRWDGQGCQGAEQLLNPDCSLSMIQSRTVTAIFCQVGQSCAFSPPPTDLECGVPSADGVEQLADTPRQVTCGWQLPVLPAGEEVKQINFYLGTAPGEYGPRTVLPGPVTLHTAPLPILPAGTRVFITVTATSGPVGSGLVEGSALTGAAAATPGEDESGFAVEASVVVPAGLEAWDIFNDGNTGTADWRCEVNPATPEEPCEQVRQLGNIQTDGDPGVGQRGTYLALRNGVKQGRTDYTMLVNLQSDSPAGGDVGVMFRVEEGGTYYRFSWNQAEGYRRLVRSDGGVFTVLCEEHFSNGIPTVIGPDCTTDGAFINPGPEACVIGELYQLELDLLGPQLHLVVRELTQGAQTVVDWTVVQDGTGGTADSIQGSGYANYTARNPDPGAVFTAISFIGQETPAAQSVEVRQVGLGRGTVQGDVAGLTCSPDCAETFDETLSAIMLTAQPAAGSEFMGWTEDIACAAEEANRITNPAAQVTVPLLPGTRCLIAEFAGAPVPPYNLDVNGDGVADGVDGQAVVAYLFGLRGSALQTIGVTSTSTRTEVGALEGYLDQAQSLLGAPMLDMDGNGQSNALSDGLLVQRVLEALAAGATIETLDPSLLNGVVDTTNGTRKTAATIYPYLGQFLPSSASSGLTEEGSAAPTDEIVEPTLTPAPTLVPAPDAEPEAVTKPERRKGPKKTREKRRAKRARNNTR
jgi:hypothetical protein